MSGKSIIFDEKKIEISNFYKNKKSFKINDIDAKEILTSKKKKDGKIKPRKYLFDIVIMMTLNHYI